jgi:nicotinamidase-related amidase
MKAIFFLDIDTQRDLILTSGSLYVPGAERLMPKLRRIFDFARKHDIFVLSSADAHEQDDVEFQTLPPHCLQKTEGQRRIDETLLPRPFVFENKPVDRNLIEIIQKNRQVIIQKQSFDIFSNPVTEKLLRALPPHAIVFGVPLEHSVRIACLGLLGMGIKTAVISDAVRPLSPRHGDKALEDMRQAGVEFIALDALLAIPAI